MLELLMQVFSVVWESSWTPWILGVLTVRHLVVRRIEDDIAIAAEEAELAKDDWRTPVGVSFEEVCDPFGESDLFEKEASNTPIVDSWGDPTNPFSDSYWK